METSKAIFMILDYVDHLDKSKSGYTQNGLFQMLENWWDIDEEKYRINTGAIVIVWALKEYARSKNKEAVILWLKELDKTCESRSSPDYGKNCIIGECYFELGDEQKAFEYLNLSYQEYPPYIKSEDKKYLKFVLSKL